MRAELLLLGLSILWAVTVVFLLGRAILQYRKYEVLRPTELAVDQAAAKLTVIVPARNERQTIGRALAGLTQQDYPRDALRILVLDDQSSDGTAEVVRSWIQRDSRVQLARSEALPPGWTGKSHACWCASLLASNAAPWEPDWLCFMDADTAAQPPLLRIAVSIAQQRQLDFLSLEPRQELLTWSERLILPMGFLLLAFIHDLGAVNDPSDRAATANGQFILVRRVVYDRLGGHGAPSVRSAICEDAALARLFKHSQYRIALLGTEHLLSARMYRSFAALWEGLGKNLTQMIGTSTATLATAAAALMLATAAVGIPLWAILFLHWHGGTVAWSALALGLMASAALLGAHVGAARYLQIPWPYGLLFPAGYALGAALAVSAVWRRASGRVTWKGRSYGGGETTAADPPVTHLAHLPETRT